MKRTITILAAMLCAALAYAQSWDYLKSDYGINDSNAKYENNGVKVPVYKSFINELGNSKIAIADYKFVEMPAPIFEEYSFGRKCYSAGCVCIGIGLPMAIAGGIVYGTAFHKSTNYNSATKSNTTEVTMDAVQGIAGEVMLGLGSTLVSISIPLLCFGDHMKREANWQYRLLPKY